MIPYLKKQNQSIFQQQDLLIRKFRVVKYIELFQNFLGPKILKNWKQIVEESKTKKSLELYKNHLQLKVGEWLNEYEKQKETLSNN